MRNDIHRPSILKIEDYAYVGIAYDRGGDAVYSDLAAINAHIERTGGTYSTHAHGGSCHICGAHAMYMVVFHHIPSNTYIKTGFDCAEKLERYEDLDAFKRQVANVLNARAGKAKAKQLLADAELSAAWDIYAATNADNHTYRHNKIGDIVDSVVSYGNLSDRQSAFMRRLLNEIANPAPAVDKAPVPVGKVTLEGTIASFKTVDTAFGTAVKMVLQGDGWRCYGTMPKSLDDVSKGARVRFTATVEASHDDPSFGFYSRPGKAVVLAAV